MKTIQLNSKTFVVLKPGASEREVRAKFEEHERNYFKAGGYENQLDTFNRAIGKGEVKPAKRTTSLKKFKENIF